VLFIALRGDRGADGSTNSTANDRTVSTSDFIANRGTGGSADSAANRCIDRRIARIRLESCQCK
jgi:hypothetical protein